MSKHHQLGKLKKVENLREIWPNEANDFTKWLAEEENFALLCSEIGMDLTVEERESPVGGFRLDLYAEEDGTGRKVVIENQLEATNHDHLGKIITYASGKDASTIIWIVREAREEHRKAIEWLNQHTDEDTGFFLIEIELWKVDSSRPAVRFNLVESPNNWAKAVKSSKEMTETRQFNMDFWENFNKFAYPENGSTEYSRIFNKTKSQPDNWKNVPIGVSKMFVDLYISRQKKKAEASIYIRNRKDEFFRLKEYKEEISGILGEPVDFRENSKDCKIIVTKDMDLETTEGREECFEWLMDKALRFKKATDQFIIPFK